MFRQFNCSDVRAEDGVVDDLVDEATAWRGIADDFVEHDFLAANHAVSAYVYIDAPMCAGTSCVPALPWAN